MKDLSKMSERELRAECKAWREFGDEYMRRSITIKYQITHLRGFVERLRGEDVGDLYAKKSGAKRA